MVASHLSRWLRLAVPLFLLLAGPSGLFCGAAAAAPVRPAAPAVMMDCDRTMPAPADPAPDGKKLPGDAVCRVPCILVVPVVAAPLRAPAAAVSVEPQPVSALAGLRDPPDYPPPRFA